MARKSMTILPGVRVNFNKRGTSLTVAGHTFKGKQYKPNKKAYAKKPSYVFPVILSIFGISSIILSFQIAESLIQALSYIVFGVILFILGVRKIDEVDTYKIENSKNPASITPALFRWGFALLLLISIPSFISDKEFAGVIMLLVISICLFIWGLVRYEYAKTQKAYLDGKFELED